MLFAILSTMENPDDRAFMQETYLNYERLMYTTAGRYVSDREVLADIMQDSVVKLVGKVDTLRGLECRRLAAYITATVRNTAINYLRQEKRRQTHTVILEEDEGDRLEDPGPSPDELVILSEDRRALGIRWERLPQEDRLLLESKYLLGYTDRELAWLVQCRESSVRMKLSRARKRALALLTGGEGDEVCDKTGTASGDL